MRWKRDVEHAVLLSLRKLLVVCFGDGEPLPAVIRQLDLGAAWPIILVRLVLQDDARHIVARAIQLDFEHLAGLLRLIGGPSRVCAAIERFAATCVIADILSRGDERCLHVVGEMPDEHKLDGLRLATSEVHIRRHHTRRLFHLLIRGCSHESAFRIERIPPGKLLLISIEHRQRVDDEPILFHGRQQICPIDVGMLCRM